ncbi:MAG: ATP synthase F0 subunit B [Candidatus Adiutrix sp.]
MVSIDFDFSLFVQLANFILLILALNHFLYKPIRKVLAERHDLFAKLESKVAQGKSALENGEAERARLTALALRDGLDLKTKLTEQSLLEEKEMLSIAQKKASDDINEARIILQQSASAARAHLTLEIQTIAGEMANKILGRKV